MNRCAGGVESQLDLLRLVPQNQTEELAGSNDFFVCHRKAFQSMVRMSVTSSGNAPDGYLTNSIKRCAADPLEAARDRLLRGGVADRLDDMVHAEQAGEHHRRFAVCFHPLP